MKSGPAVRTTSQAGPFRPGRRRPQPVTAAPQALARPGDTVGGARTANEPRTKDKDIGGSRSGVHQGSFKDHVRASGYGLALL